MVLNGTIDKEMGSITYAQKREQVADETIFMDEGKIVERERMTIFSTILNLIGQNFS